MSLFIIYKYNDSSRTSCAVFHFPTYQTPTTVPFRAVVEGIIVYTSLHVGINTLLFQVGVPI